MALLAAVFTAEQDTAASLASLESGSVGWAHAVHGMVLIVGGIEN